MLAVARHWVKVPPDQLEELKRLNRKLGSAPSGLTHKNQDLVRRFEDRDLAGRALLDLPKVAGTAATRRLSPARRLQKIQIALAIELLLAAPMRLQNLAMLELDRSLQWPSGRNGRSTLSCGATRPRMNCRSSTRSKAEPRHLLHEYLDRYRSYAKVKDRHWLFVRMDGTRVPDSALRDGITKAIARELGITMTPAHVPTLRRRDRTGCSSRAPSA